MLNGPNVRFGMALQNIKPVGSEVGRARPGPIGMEGVVGGSRVHEVERARYRAVPLRGAASSFLGSDLVAIGECDSPRRLALWRESASYQSQGRENVRELIGRWEAIAHKFWARHPGFISLSFWQDRYAPAVREEMMADEGLAGMYGNAASVAYESYRLASGLHNGAVATEELSAARRYVFMQSQCYKALARFEPDEKLSARYRAWEKSAIDYWNSLEMSVARELEYVQKNPVEPTPAKLHFQELAQGSFARSAQAAQYEDDGQAIRYLRVSFAALRASVKLGRVSAAEAAGKGIDGTQKLVLVAEHGRLDGDVMKMLHDFLLAERRKSPPSRELALELQRAGHWMSDLADAMSLGSSMDPDPIRLLDKAKDIRAYAWTLLNYSGRMAKTVGDSALAQEIYETLVDHLKLVMDKTAEEMRLQSIAETLLKRVAITGDRYQEEASLS